MEFRTLSLTFSTGEYIALKKAKSEWEDEHEKQVKWEDFIKAVILKD